MSKFFKTSAAAILTLGLFAGGIVAAPNTAPAEAASYKSSEAWKALNKLTVKGRAPKTGYKRSLYGTAWKDVNKNKCDTRNDILNRDLSNKKWGDKKKCIVNSGVLKDSYTGKTIKFKRGAKTSSAVQIDHIVALSDSWQKGAQKWSKSKKEKFANDPLNLAAVDGPQNSQKGDKDAASWLPKNKSVRCEYVSRQIAVKKKYGVWVTKAEKAAMQNILKGCPKQKLPNSNGNKGFTFTAVKGTGTSTTTPKTTTKKTDPKFSSCAAAKKAGYGPYKKGTTEYTWYRDGDGDGWACE